MPPVTPASSSGFASVKQQAVILLFIALVAIPVVILCREFLVDRSTDPSVIITRDTYRGWTNAIRLANGQAEVRVVPGIGRIMQFRFLDQDDEGPFWENAERAGKAPDPTSSDWGNFGGDKTWPTPQSSWAEWTPRAWPPPATFDSVPLEASVDQGKVVLRSPVDPHLGIQTRREIRLDASRPRMTVVTTYEKVAVGKPQVSTAESLPVGVWIITQLRDPKGVFIPVPVSNPIPQPPPTANSGGTTSAPPTGFVALSETLPIDLQQTNGLLSLRRDPKKSHKIGTQSGTLLWIGDKVALRIDSTRLAGEEYPDSGSSAEVYTNPDPLPYVELELLGPVRKLGVGETLSQTNVYTLHRLRGADLDVEARRILDF